MSLAFLYGVGKKAAESGVDTSDATATADDILLGKTAYVNGEKITGTIETYENEYKQAQFQEMTITENGEYVPDDGYIGLSKVTVDVTIASSNLQEKTITENGSYVPDTGYDGFSTVTVNVPNNNGNADEIIASFVSGSITSVKIPYGVTRINNYAFASCSSLVDVSIPESVTGISGSAFSNCRGLQNITIPSSVTNIYASAFSSCTNLKSFVVLATTPPTMSNSSIFSGCPVDMAIYVPAASVEAYKTASYWSDRADYIQAIEEV